jgi:hypothetical protein
VVAPFESGPIEAALARVFGAWKIGRPLRGCNPSRLGVYSRVELTRSLAAVFDRLIEERDAPLTTDASLLETIAP